MIDKFDQEAEALLPCVVGQWINPCRMGDHNPRCSYELRPAVAARLREDGEILFKQIVYDMSLVVVRNNEIAQAQAEIERLQALDAVSAKAHNANLLEIAALRSQLDEAREEINQLHNDNREAKDALLNWLAANRQASESKRS